MRDWGQSQALTHFPSKEWAITFYFKDTVAFAPCNPLVVFISIWQSFKKCSRAAQNALEGRMRPAGRSLPTLGLDEYASHYQSFQMLLPNVCSLVYF